MYSHSGVSANVSHAGRVFTVCKKELMWDKCPIDIVAGFWAFLTSSKVHSHQFTHLRCSNTPTTTQGDLIRKSQLADITCDSPVSHVKAHSFFSHSESLVPPSHFSPVHFTRYIKSAFYNVTNTSTFTTLTHCRIKCSLVRSDLCHFYDVIATLTMWFYLCNVFFHL
jgi:hypothetical protein